MKKILIFPILLLLAFPIRAFSQASAYLGDTLQKTLEATVKQYNLKSAAAAVVLPDGSYWQGATGNCGSNPTKPDMLFEMGSNTKTFTASLILLLADEGKLKLDDTIFTYLPPIKNVANGITIRQLLNHTSGIYNYTEHPDFAQVVNTQIDLNIKPDTILNSWIGPMNFKPGTKWEYSNTNYILLGLIIEKLDKRVYHESLRKRLLAPFLLQDMSLDPQEPYSKIKAGTWLDNGMFFDMHFVSFMSAAWAAGAIVSTPKDLAEWAWQLYGGKVLPNHWLDSMQVVINLNPTTSYGLGMMKRNLAGKIYLGHGGTTLQNSAMDYSIDKNFSVVTVVNEQNKSLQVTQIQNQLLRLVDKLVDKAMSIEKQGTITQNTVNIFPNPSSSNFTLTVPNYISTSSYNFEVYNMEGKLICKNTINAPSYSINTEDWGKGIYFIQIKDIKSNKFYTEKLIKN